MTSAVEGEIPRERAILIKQAEMWLKMSDLYDRLVGVIKGLSHWSDRGPEDFEKNQRDLENLLASAIREGVRRSHVQIGSYNEGGGGNSSWQKWMLTLLGTLAVAGIVGGVAMYGKLSSLDAKVESVQNQVNDVKRIVEPRYRGSTQ